MPPERPDQIVTVTRWLGRMLSRLPYVLLDLVFATCETRSLLHRVMGFIGSISFMGSILAMFSADSLSVSFSAFFKSGSLRIDSI